MGVQQDGDTWRYDKMIKGVRLRGTASEDGYENTRAGAEQAERERIARHLHPTPPAIRREVITYQQWFHGRFWTEWVVAEGNKPNSRETSKSHYKCHIGPVFGAMPVTAIDTASIQQFRAALVAKGLAKKTINNILIVLGKSLRYALDVEVIDKMPLIRLYKIDTPEIEVWSFEEYARILASARAHDPRWYAAVCLAGEAGFRIGEVRALRWREDVDLAERYISVNRQRGNGIEDTPKGRTSRSIPMSATLHAALAALPVPRDAPRDLRGNPIREGYVVRNPDGRPMTDPQTTKAIQRIYEGAGLADPDKDRAWHVLRHTFATHASAFSVNPWDLMTWMGHKAMDQTLGYVQRAKRVRQLPPAIVAAGMEFTNSADRVVAMLGARRGAFANDLPTAAAGGETNAVKSAA